MQKSIIKLMSIIMVVLMVMMSLVPPAFASAPAVNERKTGGAANHEFIKPVTHQTAAPEGCIGIYTASDLNNVRNNPAADYIMMNDIDLAGWGNWAPIGEAAAPFSGVFNGNGYVIKNMTIDITSENTVYAGLFSYADKAELINVGLIDALISITSTKSVFVSGLAGSAKSSTITNCFNKGESNSIKVLSASRCNAGGISTDFSKEVANCYNTSLITVNAQSAHVGGVCSSYQLNLINCYNTGIIDVSAETYAWVGGICGYQSAQKIVNCYNTGEIKAGALVDCFVGGIAGTSKGINTSYNVGKITIKDGAKEEHCGGISGFNQFKIIMGGSTPISDFYAKVFNLLPLPFVGLMRCCYCLNNTPLKAVGNAEESVLSMWNVKALSDEQMRRRSSFRGFDFHNVWVMPEDGGYPVFRQNPNLDTGFWSIFINFIFGWM